MPATPLARLLAQLEASRSASTAETKDAIGLGVVFGVDAARRVVADVTAHAKFEAMTESDEFRRGVNHLATLLQTTFAAIYNGDGDEDEKSANG